MAKIDLSNHKELSDACLIIAKHLGAARDLANFNSIHSLLVVAYEAGDREFRAKYPPACGRVRVYSSQDLLGVFYDYSAIEKFDGGVRVTWLGETTAHYGHITIYPRKT